MKSIGIRLIFSGPRPYPMQKENITAGAAGPVYRRHLAASAPSRRAGGGAWNGLWAADPGLPAARLAERITALEANPATTILKQDPGSCVLRGTLLGADALVKRFDLRRGRSRLSYLARPSKARRFWAAARTFQDLGLPTPAPLGFLEEYRAGVPARSYIVTAFLPDAVQARQWIGADYIRLPEVERAAARGRLRDLLLAMYRQGAYHRDTKMENLLAQPGADPARPALSWIDLECVRCGRPPGRNGILRNLVQINGSLAPQVSEADRCAFLQDLAAVYPWLRDPAVARQILRWTGRRLYQEYFVP